MTSTELAQIAARIELIVFDIDGVFTDGSLYFDKNGEALKKFNVYDGYGIKQLQQAGVEVAIISGRSSKIVDLRMNELGVRHVFQGCEDKLPVFLDLLKKLDIEAQHTAYVGDDLPDIDVMASTGLAIAVANARFEVIAQAHWCTHTSGGQGAVREVAEFLLEARNRPS
ncbi:MAG: HAD-IIIA family hydrolase [Gammaproteobacteria bacterium]|nr:HAD-IIIA family hydrolase [Gammaproteobacteria bacterium]